MSFEKLTKRALEIRKKYQTYELQKFGRAWTKEDILTGLVGDIGDLAKLSLAAKGIRDIPLYQKKIAHELSDCLWSLIVLAEEHGVDLEKEFKKTMDKIEVKISTK